MGQGRAGGACGERGGCERCRGRAPCRGCAVPAPAPVPPAALGGLSTPGSGTRAARGAAAMWELQRAACACVGVHTCGLSVNTPCCLRCAAADSSTCAVCAITQAHASVHSWLWCVCTTRCMHVCALSCAACACGTVHAWGHVPRCTHAHTIPCTHTRPNAAHTRVWLGCAQVLCLHWAMPACMPSRFPGTVGPVAACRWW